MKFTIRKINLNNITKKKERKLLYVSEMEGNLPFHKITKNTKANTKIFHSTRIHKN